jgi:proteasome lid subunit RPN8/RPN11
MLWIPHAEYLALRLHGEAAYPHESCGVLLGSALGEARLVRRAVPCHNGRTDSPTDRYHLDPRELMRLEREARSRGEEVLGFYHSHPDHPAHWSGTDLAEAHWLGCSYVITRVAEGRAEETCSFLLSGEGEADKRFEEEDLGVLDASAEAADGEAIAP